MKARISAADHDRRSTKIRNRNLISGGDVKALNTTWLRSNIQGLPITNFLQKNLGLVDTVSNDLPARFANHRIDQLSSVQFFEYLYHLTYFFATQSNSTIIDGLSLLVSGVQGRTP
jgi:hypothetical protein